MDVQPVNFTPIRFSTDGLPEADRIPFFRDFFGPAVCHFEIESSCDQPFHAEVTLQSVPDVDLVSCRVSPLRLLRTPALLADGNDNIALYVSSAAGSAAQRGREVTHQPGDAVVVTAAEATRCVLPFAAHYRCFHVRRAALATMVPELDGMPARLIPGRAPALQHLMRYVGFLRQAQPLTTAELAQVSGRHLCDLVALAIGATGEAAELAETRGLRAARLAAIKADIADCLDRPGLTVSEMAARHGITPRYIQLLFESEGTTFSEFVLHQRLERAHRLLTDQHFARYSIGALALEAGFGDISYFNRTFRRHFGATPSAIRATALRNDRSAT